MTIITEFGYKIPELEDKDFWDSYNFNIARYDAHNHTGVDSALVPPQATLDPAVATGIAHPAGFDGEMRYKVVANEVQLFIYSPDESDWKKTSIFDDVSPMTTGGDLIYGGASGTGTRLPNGDINQVLTSAGTTLPPTWEDIGGGDVVGPASATDNALARFDTTTGKLIQDGTITQDDSGNLAAVGTINTHTIQGGTGTLALTSDITGTNSGTNTGDQTFDDTNPMTTGGDVLYGGASGTGTRLANGVAGQVLTSAGTTDAPTWETPGAGSGDVVGPAGSTDNALARYDSTTGKLLQGGTITQDDSGNLASVGTLNTHTIQGGTGTLALTTDITGTNSGTNTGDEVAASDSVAGVSELATIAEIDTGTDTVRTITPAGLAGSDLQTQVDGLVAATILQELPYTGVPVLADMVALSAESRARNKDVPFNYQTVDVSAQVGGGWNNTAFGGVLDPISNRYFFCADSDSSTAGWDFNFNLYFEVSGVRTGSFGDVGGGGVYVPTLFEGRGGIFWSVHSSIGKWARTNCESLEYDQPLITGDAQSSGSNWSYYYSPLNDRVYFIKPGVLGVDPDVSYYDVQGDTFVTVAQSITVLQDYRSGSYCPTNDRIYLIPRTYATGSADWHYIDCTNGELVAYTGIDLGTGLRYQGGHMDPINNRIYMGPLLFTGTSNWHYIDCATGTVVAYSNSGSADPDIYRSKPIFSPATGRLYFPAEHADAEEIVYIDCNESAAVLQSVVSTGGYWTTLWGGTYIPSISSIVSNTSSIGVWNMLVEACVGIVPKSISGNPLFQKS